MSRWTHGALPWGSRKLSREEGVLQSLSWSNPLIWVERQASLQKVYEVVQISRLHIVHTARGGKEASAKITSRLDNS